MKKHKTNFTLYSILSTCIKLLSPEVTNFFFFFASTQRHANVTVYKNQKYFNKFLETTNKNVYLFQRGFVRAMIAVFFSLKKKQTKMQIAIFQIPTCMSINR